MKIIQKVLIKQVITEKNKNKLHNKFNKDKEQLEIECEQLLFEQKKIKNRNKADVSNRFKKEIKKRQEKISLVNFKIDQLDILKVGSEIVESEVEALVDVSIGSNWDSLQTEQAVVIKDDIVVRIDR